ncbi:hypothetical protein SUGI_0263380 [Cryptomeria japonica]|nr:hypothetical protein SUGI_0263380 [Cryptomeria japonica]
MAFEVNIADIEKRLKEHLGKNSYHSAKVFSALYWSWSSKSPLAGRDIIKFQIIDESGRRGSHCSTLEKLHAQKKRLYEEGVVNWEK